MAWSRVISGGGALLALCFFLPAVHACDSDTVPSEQLVALLARPAPTTPDLLLGIGMFAVPYLFGLTLLLGTWRQPPRWQYAVDVAVALLVAYAALLALAVVVVDLSEGPSRTLLFLLPVAATALYMTRALRRGRPGRWCLRWYGSILCTIWFATWCVVPGTRYGLWLSLASSLSLVIAFTAAVAVQLRVPVWAALRALLLCRPGATPG